ncbi:GntR family transcriptional regulator [Marispirochaeta aestuarii]|uniref:GntR family transcriptional regulator n=1 Tax=Marispirochaeta aestuarii TaxID=1963862 RepID=UPI002ABD84CD|nr:GntR family transcriptional regulator [Marispirochaeta aestuarii]
MRLDRSAINKSIPIPLYYQLKQHLRDYIDTCRVGDPIPTENELCTHFEISRPTVRQAITELVTEGYLVRSKGKGTFVTKPKVQRDFRLALSSFNREMRDKGVSPSTRVLDLYQTKADTAVAEKLGLQSGDTVFFLRRLRSADRQPLMIVNTFLPAGLVPGFDSHDFSQVALHTLLSETYAFELALMRRSIEAIAAPKEAATLLEIKPGSPVQYTETIVYTDHDIPIEFSLGWYRGDHSRFTLEVRAE